MAPQTDPRPEPQPVLRPDYRRRARAYAAFGAAVLGVAADLALPLLRAPRNATAATPDPGPDD
ncbi:hypothetical protein [Streptomyces caatingaensis]|nr:hypothetical protein [Streptomyces caatingaensis]